MKKVHEITLMRANTVSEMKAAINPERDYLLVPYSLRFLPIMTWGRKEKGWGVLTEDIRTTGEVNWNQQPSDDIGDELPGNVTAVRLDNVFMARKDMNFFAGRKLDGKGLGSLPKLSEPDLNVHLDEMDTLKLSYTLIGSDGERELELRPDVFIFEDDEGRYSVYHQQDADTVTWGWLDSALHVFMTGQQELMKIRDSEIYDENWKIDLRITEVGIAAAMARGDERGALIRAAYHFGVPTTGIVKHIPREVMNG